MLATRFAATSSSFGARPSGTNRHRIVNPTYQHLDQQWIRHREFVTQRINEINQWRQEAARHAETKEQRERIDARVFDLREKLEKQF